MPDSLRIVQQFFPEVKSVKQATKNVQVEVLRRDSTRGQTKAHEACAMARACKRALKLDGAVVSLGTAYLIRGPLATRYHVPQSVSREIVSFDRGSGFAPGVYALYKPVKAAAKGTGTYHPGGKGKARPTPKHTTANVRAMLGSG